MGLSDLVQKAVYIGIGAASYAGEKAGGKLTEFSGQLQKLADEMVERGEMTAEEARRYVDEKMKTAQQEFENLSQQATQAAQSTQSPQAKSPTAQSKEPRRIEIIDEDETPAAKTSDQSASKADVKSEVTPPIEAPKPEASQKSVDPIEEMRRQVAELQDELKRLRS
jgi:polyhydroxyalkanoate synthesis regulator phasin